MVPKTVEYQSEPGKHGGTGMKKTTYVLITCMILFLGGCLHYFFKDEPIKPQEPVQVAASESSTLSYVGNTIKEEKDGKPLWELSAETIEIDTNTKNATFKNSKGVFYQDNGGKIEIIAPEAVVDSKTKEIRMVGKVEAIASDGTTFRVQEIRWFTLEQRFYGTGNVLLTKNDTVMSGDQIESDGNLSKIKVSGRGKIVKGGS